MRETQAIIERVRRVNAAIQRIELSTDAALAQLEPGHSLFAHILENVNWNPYLREHWVPVEITPAKIVIEHNAARVYNPGQAVSLLSPIGRPIPLRSGASHLLFIVQDAPPTPLLMLARRVLDQGAAVTMVLGGTATEYPLELLPPEVEILRADTDWAWPEQVDTIAWADQVIALAPSYAQIEVYAALWNQIVQLRNQNVPDGFVLGMFAQTLACGSGVCQACQIACHGKDKSICTDGPALDLKQVKLT